MKNAAAILIVAGLLLGPGYLVFCEYFSGQSGETHVLKERASRWQLPDGAILRLKSGLAYKPVVLDLNPDLNLYQMELSFDVAAADPPRDAQNGYQVSLLQGDLTVFERSFTISGAAPGPVTLEPVDIFYPGSYVLLVEEVGTPPLAVAGISLELRNKVERPTMWLAWCGLVMLSFGVFVLVRDWVRWVRR